MNAGPARGVGARAGSGTSLQYRRPSVQDESGVVSPNRRRFENGRSSHHADEERPDDDERRGSDSNHHGRRSSRAFSENIATTVVHAIVFECLL
jgi:hypothetical protein